MDTIYKSYNSFLANNLRRENNIAIIDDTWWSPIENENLSFNNIEDSIFHRSRETIFLNNGKLSFDYDRYINLTDTLKKQELTIAYDYYNECRNVNLTTFISDSRVKMKEIKDVELDSIVKDWKLSIGNDWKFCDSNE